MTKTIRKFAVILTIINAAILQKAYSEEKTEYWKGSTSPEMVNFTLMTGNGTAGYPNAFTLMSMVAVKMMDRGFLDEINNQVFIEGEIGPHFVTSSPNWLVGARIRWDFEMNLLWRFYAAGGAGFVIPNSDTKAPFPFYPRIALGTFIQFNAYWKLRAEVSHEFTGVGLTFAL